MVKRNSEAFRKRMAEEAKGVINVKSLQTKLKSRLSKRGGNDGKDN